MYVAKRAAGKRKDLLRSTRGSLLPSSADTERRGRLGNRQVAGQEGTSGTKSRPGRKERPNSFALLGSLSPAAPNARGPLSTPRDRFDWLTVHHRMMSPAAVVVRVMVAVGRPHLRALPPHRALARALVRARALAPPRALALPRARGLPCIQGILVAAAAAVRVLVADRFLARPLARARLPPPLRTWRHVWPCRARR